jgi:uncharacterized protein (DUF305 family)
MNRSLPAISSIALALALPLAACGSSANGDSKTTVTAVASAAATAGSFNDADVAFAQGMIPHHEQAVEMADMALDPTAGAGAKIAALAKAIKAAQDPEIATMKVWLAAWGKDASGAMAGMDHSAGAMPGMMSGADMTTLGKSKGAEFDKMWATMMIVHHKGAIEMANTELTSGQAAEAKTLATAVINGQQKEIDQMTALLKG